MRHPKLIWLAILILCALSCSAAAQEARVLERLSDGSYIVQIDGQQYRALTGEKVLQLGEQKIELKACKDQAALSTERLTLLEKQNAVLTAKDEVSAQRIAALEQIANQLAANPKQSRASSAFGLLLRLGEVGWRIYATAK